jgi:transposase
MGRTPTLTEEDQKEVVRLIVKKNLSRETVAQKFDVSIRTIDRLLKKLRDVIPPPKGRYKYYKGYFVYADGRVWSTTSFKFLVPYFDKDGYAQFDLYHQCRKKRYILSRLILILFDREPKEGEVARHKDGKPYNTYLSNLEWGTVKENVNDQKKHGTKLLGSKCSNSKLNEDEVRLIKYHWKNKLTNFTQKEFGQIWGDYYGVSWQAIARIIGGVNWRHL